MASVSREFAGECFDFDRLSAFCLGGLVLKCEQGGCFSFTRKEKMFWRFFQLVLARVSNIQVSKFRFGEGNG